MRERGKGSALRSFLSFSRSAMNATQTATRCVSTIDTLAAYDATMIDACEIRLARTADAERIAVMSRDFIEYGLGWGWNAARVVRRIRHRATNVVVAECA